MGRPLHAAPSRPCPAPQAWLACPRSVLCAGGGLDVDCCGVPGQPRGPAAGSLRGDGRASWAKAAGRTASRLPLLVGVSTWGRGHRGREQPLTCARSALGVRHGGASARRPPIRGPPSLPLCLPAQEEELGDVRGRGGTNQRLVSVADGLRTAGDGTGAQGRSGRPPQPRVAPAPPWAPGSWGGQHLSWRAGLWHCTHTHTHTHTRPTPSSPSEWQGQVEAA